MNSYEREYFVSRIRSGVYHIKLDDGIRVRILTPTIEEEFISNEIYMDLFDEARSDGIFTNDEMLDWMINKNLWTTEKEEKIDSIKKDIEKKSK